MEKEANMLTGYIRGNCASPSLLDVYESTSGKMLQLDCLPERYQTYPVVESFLYTKALVILRAQSYFKFCVIFTFHSGGYCLDNTEYKILQEKSIARKMFKLCDTWKFPRFFVWMWMFR